MNANAIVKHIYYVYSKFSLQPVGYFIRRICTNYITLPVELLHVNESITIIAKWKASCKVSRVWY